MAIEEALIPSIVYQDKPRREAFTGTGGKAVYASLSLEDYGVVPFSQSIEARVLKNKGFSVVITADPELEPRPRRIGYTKKDYDWRTFGKVLCQIEDGFITPDSCSFVEVMGEEGIRGEILSLCWSYPEADREWIDWLLLQSDESLGCIQSQLGSILSEEAYQLLSSLAVLTKFLFHEPDILEVVSTNYSLQDLYEWMEAKKVALDDQKAEEDKKALAPFTKLIAEAIEVHGDDRRFRGGGGISRPSKSSFLQSWLEQYILKNKEFPIGPHEVKVSHGMFRQNLGTLYFRPLNKSS